MVRGTIGVLSNSETVSNRIFQEAIRNEIECENYLYAFSKGEASFMDGTKIKLFRSCDQIRGYRFDYLYVDKNMISQDDEDYHSSIAPSVNGNTYLVAFV